MKTFAVIGVVISIVYGCDSGSTRVVSYDDCVLDHTKRLTNAAVLDAIKVSCKQKHPKTFEFVAIASSANILTWPEVAAMEEMRAQNKDQQERSRNEYFIDVIAPRIHPDFVAEARTQFDSFARGVEKQMTVAKLPKIDKSAHLPGSTPLPQPEVISKYILLPLPQNGHAVNYSPQQRIAPFSIVTRDPDRHFYVKLEDWNSGGSVIGFFVRAGQAVETKVPVGSYRIKYATGTQWYGYEELFGTDTTYHEAKKRFEFAEGATEISGYTVELFLQPQGNLQTAHIDKSKW